MTSTDKATIKYGNALFYDDNGKGFCNLCLDRNPKRFFKIQVQHYPKVNINKVYLHTDDDGNTELNIGGQSFTQKHIENASFNMTIYVCRNCHDKHYEFYNISVNDGSDSDSY